MAAVQKMAFGLKIRLDIYINSTRVRNMSSSTIVVETKSGSYRGYTKKSTGGRGFFSFRGIPYAQAPIGKLRFQMPQPVMPHLDVLDACKCGPDCPQFNLFTRQVTGSEDNCLSLNIYSPISTSLDSRKRPVVIWVHGGGFSFGSGSDFIYGPNYAMDQDIVFVTINYRLSIFGFCNGIKGIPPNLGLHDQRLAIQWIKDNIINFGGDMSNITLMGESAGAASVHSHSLSDHNHLFQKMILQSGTAFCPWAYMTDRSNFSAQRLFNVLHCNSVEELREIDSHTLVKATAKINGPLGHNRFLPDLDDEVFFGKHQGKNMVVKHPCLMGTNANEGDFLVAMLMQSTKTKDILNKSPSSALLDILMLSSDGAQQSVWTKKRLLEEEDKSTNTDETKKTPLAGQLILREYDLLNGDGLHGSRSISVDWAHANWARKFSQIISDAMFVHPWYRLLKQNTSKANFSPDPEKEKVEEEKENNAEKTKAAAKMFVYKYSHRGQFSFPRLILMTSGSEDIRPALEDDDDIFGVSHFDEILIMFNNKLVPPSLRNEKDEKVARFIWTSWAKFAHCGEPGWPPSSNEQAVVASKATSVAAVSSSIEYLNIQLEPRCQNTGLFDEKKMAFWDNLLFSASNSGLRRGHIKNDTSSVTITTTSKNSKL